VAVAKDFLKYLIQPQVLNGLLKTGLGPQSAGDAGDREERPVVARPPKIRTG